MGSLLKRALVWASAVSVLTAGAGTAQRVIPCDAALLVSYGPKTFIASGLDKGMSKLQGYYPASFPNPERNKFIEDPVTMKCSGYTVKNGKDFTRIDGPIAKTIKLITPPFRDGEIDASVPPRRFVLAYANDYIYPNIREDYFQQRLSAELKDGRLFFNYDGQTYQILFKDLTVGAKVNGGPLQPVFFQNKVSQIKHDGDDRVEVFLKGESVAFDYVLFDFGKGIIHMKNGVPFPKK